MYRNLKHIVSICLFGAFLLQSGATGVKAEVGMAVLIEYLDLVQSGNFESARMFWTDACQRRASRFGIEYIDIPLKIDCASTAVRNPELMYQYHAAPITTETKLASDNFKRFTLSVKAGNELLKHYYYTQQVGDYHWLSFPQEYWSQGWQIVETKYFRIHVQPGAENLLNPITLDRADQFVEDVSKKIKLDGDRRKLVENEKVEYYFCSSDNMVRDITGHLTKGMYDLASDDIISAFFPHYHEITHFLVNLKLQRLHLYTQPMFREGCAVYFGGRWGKAPASLFALGGYIYREGIVTLDSILTIPGFDQSAGADLAYPLAGMFVGYVIEDKGADAYFDLYRAMSGSFDQLMAMTAEDVKAAIVERLDKKDWNRVTEEFGKYVEDWLTQNAGIYPGINKGKAVLDSAGVVVTQDGDWINVSAVMDPSSELTGGLLFGFDERLAGKGSSLFTDQYKGEPAFEGFRYGVRYDQNEVGVYDYATNVLLAKYIFGITPSEEYLDADNHVVTFRFHKDLVDSKLPEEGDYRMLRR